jgi:hypothetical protein
MSYFGSTEWYQRVSNGEVPGYSLVHKFGAGELGTTVAPVTLTGSYFTPTTAQALEFISSSAEDTSLGDGAREVTVIGLDLNWLEVEQTVITNGTTPVQLTTDLTRLYRWYVSSSGTYSSAEGGSSHSGDLTIRASGGGDDWTLIENTPLSTGQSQIGVYTIPKFKKAYGLSKSIFVDTTKVADIYVFYRDNCDDITSPFSGTRRIVEREVGVTGGFQREYVAPLGPFTGPCDIGFMAKVSQGSGFMSCEFDLLLIDE